MHLGNAWLMLESPKPGASTPARLGSGTQYLTIIVDDIELHFSKSKSADVTIIEDLHETIYGELQYGAQDLDGHIWIFSSTLATCRPTHGERR
jgi:uncharacterized glyoxalase superfamily protein PhnB